MGCIHHDIASLRGALGVVGHEAVEMQFLSGELVGEAHVQAFAAAVGRGRQHAAPQRGAVGVDKHLGGSGVSEAAGAVGDDHGDGLTVDAEAVAVGGLDVGEEGVVEVVAEQVDGAAAEAAAHDA